MGWQVTKQGATRCRDILVAATEVEDEPFAMVGLGVGDGTRVRLLRGCDNLRNICHLRVIAEKDLALCGRVSPPLLLALALLTHRWPSAEAARRHRRAVPLPLSPAQH